MKLRYILGLLTIGMLMFAPMDGFASTDSDLASIEKTVHFDNVDVDYVVKDITCKSVKADKIVKYANNPEAKLSDISIGINSFYINKPDRWNYRRLGTDNFLISTKPSYKTHLSILSPS